MESLNAHYRLLLGLNDDWAVGDVDLCVPDKRVSIALAFVGANPRKQPSSRFTLRIRIVKMDIHIEVGRIPPEVDVREH